MKSRSVGATASAPAMPPCVPGRDPFFVAQRQHLPAFTDGHGDDGRGVLKSDPRTFDGDSIPDSNLGFLIVKVPRRAEVDGNSLVSFDFDHQMMSSFE